MEFGLLLSLVSLIKLVLVVCRPMNVQARKAYLRDFVQNKTLMLACIWTFYGPISFKLSVTIDTTKVDILILDWITLIFNEGHSYLRNEKFVRGKKNLLSRTFDGRFGWNLVSCRNLFGVLKLPQNLFHAINVQWKGLYLRDFID